VKARMDQWITCIAFCAFLGIMAVLFFALPKEEYSELEKKVLAQFPEISAQSITSGTLDDQIELYMAEHLPGRTFFVGVDAYFRQLTGRQVAGDIYAARGDRLVEKPVSAEKGNLTGKMNAINAFAETVGQQVELMLLPSAGWAERIKLTMLCLFAFLLAAYALLGYGVLWNLSFLLQSFSFWLINMWSLITIKNVFLNVLSGSMIPLWFMPDWMTPVMNILPFSSIYFTPVQIYLGQLTGQEIFIKFLVQMVWIVVLYLGGNLLWEKGKKKLVVQGG